jgi:hypothetical protein
MSNRVSSAAKVIILPSVMLALLATAAIVWLVHGDHKDRVASRNMERERPLDVAPPIYNSTLQPLASGYTKMDVRLRGVPCKGDPYMQRLHNLRPQEQVLLPNSCFVTIRAIRGELIVNRKNSSRDENITHMRPPEEATFFSEDGFIAAQSGTADADVILIPERNRD